MRWIMLALTAIGMLSCGGGGAETRVPRPEHVVSRTSRSPEFPQPARPLPKTLEDVERDLGVEPGTLKREKKIDYLAATGDVLFVNFRSHPKLSCETTVTPDGQLVVPRVGRVAAEGLSPDLIREALTAMAAEAGLRNPDLSVSVKTAAAQFVTFVGPGFSGGRIKINGNGSVLETLVGSGWKPDARSARSIALIRGGRTTIIDLDQVTGLHEVDLNIRLHSDDILIAVNADPFEVKGAVGTPGTYAVPAVGQIGLQDALALAGGLKFPVQMDAVRIMRRDGRVVQVDLNRYLFSPDETAAVAVNPGDLLIVPVAHETPVFVFGMVEKPGQHRVSAPVTVSRVIARAVPLKFGAVLSECRVVRGWPEEPEVVMVDADALMNGDTSQDIVLNEGDVVFIPESFGSDVLDTLGRALGPISGTVTPGVQIYTATQIGR